MRMVLSMDPVASNRESALNAMDDLPAFSDLLALKSKADFYMTTVANPTLSGLAGELNTFLTAQLATAGITLSTLNLATEFDPATSSMLLKFTVDTGDLTCESPARVQRDLRAP